MNCFSYQIVKLEQVGSPFVSHVLATMECFVLEKIATRIIEDPYKPEAGDIHIIRSKQGEAFIQPKINTRDFADELVADSKMSRESVQDWTTKMGLVKSTDQEKLQDLFVEDSLQDYVMTTMPTLDFFSMERITSTMTWNTWTSRLISLRIIVHKSRSGIQARMDR